MRSLLVASLMVTVLAGVARGQPALDEKAARAKIHLQSAISYYGEGRYQDAAREMEVAYSLKPLADLQYNLAQCYERLNRLGDALDAYQKYVTGKPDAEDRREVELRIKNLAGRVEQEKANPGATPVTPPTATATPTPPTEKVVFKTIVVYREKPPAPGRGARIAAYGLGVLALGALASGITFSVLAKQNADLVTKSGDPTAPPLFSGKASDAQSAGRTDVVIAWVSYSVALVGALGAIGLFALGKKIDREAPKLTLAPSFSPSGGGLALAGSF